MLLGRNGLTVVKGRTLVWRSSLTRREDQEWLDLGIGSDSEVARNLFEMDRINLILGGDQALLRHLIPRLHTCTGRIRLGDLGTGSGRLPVRILGWALRQRLDVHILGLDWSGRNLKVGSTLLARHSRLSLIQADAHSLPISAGVIDYLISTLFLHHLDPPQLVQVLREANQVSTRGIVMSDLVRGWIPYFLFHLIQPFLARNRLTRHDGALSILRAYRPGELLDLAGQAGVTNPAVHVHWPWRMTLVADK